MRSDLGGWGLPEQASDTHEDADDDILAWPLHRGDRVKATQLKASLPAAARVVGWSAEEVWQARMVALMGEGHTCC